MNEEFIDQFDPATRIKHNTPRVIYDPALEQYLNKRDAEGARKLRDEKPQSTFKLGHIWYGVGTGNPTPEACGLTRCKVCGAE